MNAPYNKLKSKTLKDTCVICVSEKLLLRKYAKRKFLSLVITTSWETRRHYLIIQKLYIPTLLKKDFFFNCSSTSNHFFIFQNLKRISKVRQQSDTNNIFKPNFVSHTQGVNMLGEKGASSTPRVF